MDDTTFNKRRLASIALLLAIGGLLAVEKAPVVSVLLVGMSLLVAVSSRVSQLLGR